MIKKEKTRQSNFELMRIVSMIMIVMWHLIFHGNLINTAQGTTKFILEFLILLGVVHVNSFVIVTGYFQCDKKFSLKKILSLINTTWFYKVLFLIITLLIGTFTITKLEIFQEILPIDIRNYWFVNCYLVLYILSPYLNVLIKKMTQQQYRKLIIIGFFLFSIIPIITNNTTISNNGYTVINFCYLYLIGGYLRKYPIKENLHFKNYSKNKTQFIFLFMALFMLFLNFICYQFSKNLMIMDNSAIKQIGSNFYTNYRSFSNPLVILQTVFYFLYFSTLTIKSEVINKISKNTLDVYLIHENFYVQHLIYNYMKTSTWINFGGYTLIALTIFVPILIFIICIIISLVKDFIFKFISRRKSVKKSIDKFYNYIEEF